MRAVETNVAADHKMAPLFHVAEVKANHRLNIRVAMSGNAKKGEIDNVARRSGD